MNPINYFGTYKLVYCLLNCFEMDVKVLDRILLKLISIQRILLKLHKKYQTVYVISSNYI